MTDNPSELDKWLTKLLDAHPKQIALGLRRVRSVAERMCFKIIDKQIRLNSKVFRKHSLIGRLYNDALYIASHFNF